MSSVALLSLSLALLSPFLLTALIRQIDKDSIVSLRRILGLFFVGTLIWIIVFALGIGYSLAVGDMQSRINGLAFAAFLTASFELVVINGVFVQSTKKSLGLATIHPLSLSPLIFATNFINSRFVSSLIAGLVIFVIAGFFLLRLKTLTTKRRINSLELLQAFLKAWVVKNPKQLENYFTRYAREEEIETKITKFAVSDKNLILILPGIHPGPFYPVGSYNLSELIYAKLHTSHDIPLILHGIGGHERNLPTSEFTGRYVNELSKFVSSLSSHPGSNGSLGLTRSKIGSSNITCMTFDGEVLATVSNSPYSSDDLDPSMVADASSAAAESGFSLTLVDAHNSIGSNDVSETRITKEEWTELFNKIKTKTKTNFKLGYAHSSEVEFTHGSDISDAGIGVLVFEDGQSKNVLVVVDSNNALSGVREKIKESLREIDFDLIEVCTSDTHNFAARGLRDRGYFALGEDTKIQEIVDIIRNLVQVSHKRLDICSITISHFSTKLPLVGQESLADFASVTKEAVNFTKSLLIKAVPVWLVMLAITLFY